MELMPTSTVMGGRMVKGSYPLGVGSLYSEEGGRAGDRESGGQVNV